ncbi:hypothetical protein Leryth_024787 [Lithospermum erythrorhizon]|nr:hypothetical protein Leryth_024787 [Lithospermum erythrorhizon]
MQANNIVYWHKLVSEYYAPGAKIRWCFSLYKNLRSNGRGGFMHTGNEGWACDVCGSRSGKGFEANFEILPRVFQNNFLNDLVDEILFLEVPQERKVPSGFLVLEYEKAVLKSVYKQGRVVREGKLRVLFRQDLKILSWEFCSLKHEEFLNRHQVSSQVNQLVEAAEKCQSIDMASAEDFISNCNKFAAAGHHLAKAIDLPLVNGLGLPNRYVRCLQMAEVFHIMGDLMAFSCHSKIGPLGSNYWDVFAECLKYYSQVESSKATQKNAQCGTVRGQSTREGTLTATSFSPGSGSGSVDSCLINDEVLQADREVTIAFPYRGADNHTSSISPTSRMIKQEKRCMGDQMTEIPITSRMQVPQSPYSAKLCNSSVNIGSKRKKLQERVTSNTLEGENIPYARGRMASSAATIGSARVLKAPHSSNSSNSQTLLEIKQEPNYF